MELFTCRFLAIFNAMHALDIIHLNSLSLYLARSLYATSDACQCNRMFHWIRIYSSLFTCRFGSVRRHLHLLFRNPLSSFPLLKLIEKRREKKTCQNFLFEFLWAYQSLNLYEFFEFITFTGAHKFTDRNIHF